MSRHTFSRLLLAAGFAAFALPVSAAEHVRLTVTDHRGLSSDQEFDITVSAPASATNAWIRFPETTLSGGRVVPTFTVMKYEARVNGSVAESKPDGTPVAAIFANARAACQAACAGCDLIKETQWVALAQNALANSANWTGGAVGSGKMMYGNYALQDGNLAASSDDAQGYLGITNMGYAGSESNARRRTWLLSTGDVIWDMAGNQWERTYCDDGVTGCNSGYANAFQYWSASTYTTYEYTSLSPTTNPWLKPSTYNSTQGMGLVYLSSTAPYIIRGQTGAFSWTGDNGGSTYGFRCTGP